LFFREVGGRASTLLRALVEQGTGAGHGDPRYDPRLTMISIMSLAVFPFLAAPVLEAVLDVDVQNEEFIERLIAHSLDVLSSSLITEDPI